jgi:hypothetical protein
LLFAWAVPRRLVGIAEMDSTGSAKFLGDFAEAR